MPAPASPRAARPPTTPPTIAPVLDFFDGEEDDGFPLALGLPLLSVLSVLVEVGAAEVWLVVLEVDEDEVEVVDVLVDSGTRVLSGRSADKS